MRMMVVWVCAGVLLGAGSLAGGDAIDRAGTLGIAMFDGLTPSTESWSTQLTADLNGDGQADVVGRLGGGLRVGIVASSPAGYASVVTVDLCDCFGGDSPPIAVGDTDGDGAYEVLIADANGRRVWALPFAGGGFGAGRWIDTAGQSPARFPFEVMPDLDGDGRDDLVFARSNEIVVLPSGSPGTAFIRPAGTLSFNTLTDLTGDGLPDAVVVVQGLVKFFPGRADGFGEAVEISVSPGSVSVVDLDGDGAADLIGSDAGAGEAWIRRNEGGGVFGVERRFGAVASFGSLQSVGDLNGNGLPDVVGFMKPPGFFLSRRHLWEDPWLGSGSEIVGLVDLPRQFFSSSRDLDNDGRRDLLMMDIERITGLLNGGARLPVAGTRTTALLVDPLDVRAGDFDADGTPEIVVADLGGLSLWRRQADGSYSGETLASDGMVRFMSVPADIDGDGELDLVVAGGGGVEVWPGSVAGLGGAPARYEFDAPASLWQTAVGDVTGDGVFDIVVADSSANLVRVLVGTDGGMPGVSEEIPLEGAKAVAVLDLDGDGVHEVAASGSMSSINVFRRGPGGWGSIAEIPLPVRPYWLTAADIDADGLTDLAVGVDRFPPTTVQLLYGSPDGLSAPVDTGPPDYTGGHAEIAAGDVNGDGLVDLVVAPFPLVSGSSGMARVLLQTQPRVFVDVGLVPGRSAGGVMIADLNSDGVLDIASVCNDGSTDLLQIHYGRTPGCRADLHTDGVLNFFDIAAFLTFFHAQSPAADFAEPFGVLNFFDLSAYLAAYNAGCP